MGHEISGGSISRDDNMKYLERKKIDGSSMILLELIKRDRDI